MKKTSTNRQPVGLSLLLALAAFSPAANAGTVTLTYTGNDFTGVVGSGFTTSDFISGTFTLSGPIPSGLTSLTNEGILLSSFTVSDGVNTLTLADGFQDFQFETDSSGNITGYDLQLGNSGAAIFIAATAQFVEDNAQKGASNVGYNFNSPGVLTESGSSSSAPEPSTFFLVPGVMLAAAFVVRKRAHAAR